MPPVRRERVPDVPGAGSSMTRKRSDAERRIRQSDRLARVLRVLQLIQGSGAWTAQSLAAELECSERTVYRDLQTLSAAGVPWYFDDLSQRYRIRDGYRGPFPPIRVKDRADELAPPREEARSIASIAREAAQRLLTEAEGVVQALDRLAKAIDHLSGPRSR